MEFRAADDSGFVLEYLSDSVADGTSRIVGRQSAGLGLLRATLRRARPFPLAIAIDGTSNAEKLRQIIANSEIAQDRYRLVHLGDLGTFSQIGCALGMDSVLGERAWRRRLWADNAYSLVGITHALAPRETTERICRLLVDPVQPWDALICTSKVARGAIEETVENYRDYLKRRGIRTPNLCIRLPVIPLGIDTGAFAPNDGNDRQACRDRLQLDKDDILLLSFGRISPYDKAHPAPLLLAAQHAQTLIGDQKKLHVLFTGQFAYERLEDDIRRLAKSLAPDVGLHFFDGTDTELCRKSWRGADIFVSFADNLQETFGLTPVEAMAAGLPVVVSDWSGYRETVVDGKTGYRIATTMPASGASLGIYLAERYCAHLDPYPAYVGAVAQMISVDIKSAGEAIARLSLDANGRNKMGEAARLHAAANFDWDKILTSYDALFAELKRIRSKNQGVGTRDRGRETANAAVPDPFRIFSGFATQALSDTTVVSMSRNGGALRAHMAGLLEPEIAGIAGHAMLPPAELDHLLDRIETGPVSIASLCSGFADFHRDQILASCAWLLKYGLIETALRNSLD